MVQGNTKRKSLLKKQNKIYLFKKNKFFILSKKQVIKEKKSEFDFKELSVATFIWSNNKKNKLKISSC